MIRRELIRCAVYAYAEAGDVKKSEQLKKDPDYHERAVVRKDTDIDEDTTIKRFRCARTAEEFGLMGK